MRFELLFGVVDGFENLIEAMSGPDWPKSREGIAEPAEILARKKPDRDNPLTCHKRSS